MNVSTLGRAGLGLTALIAEQRWVAIGTLPNGLDDSSRRRDYQPRRRSFTRNYSSGAYGRPRSNRQGVGACSARLTANHQLSSRQADECEAIAGHSTRTTSVLSLGVAIGGANARNGHGGGR